MRGMAEKKGKIEGAFLPEADNAREIDLDK